MRYVALGDSTAVGVGATRGGGYPARLHERLARRLPAQLVNLGRSGATSHHVRQASEHAELRSADLVTLGVGMNDLWRMVPVETFASNLHHIADRLEATGAPIVCCNLVDLARAPLAALCEQLLGVQPTALTERAHRLNEKVAELARRPRFHVVDLHALSDDLPAHPEYFSADGFHPSALGYERWAELMWPAVEAAIREPAVSLSA